MPPPTSPENNEPQRGLTLPGLFEGIRNNSNLRHLLSRDFFARMNEVSANLLNRYTDEQNRQNSTSTAPDQSPQSSRSSVQLSPDYYRQADQSHIRTTALPAEIRNLASPVRFLVIPDLESDMDLDIDLDESPRAASSNVGSRDGMSASHPESSAPPFDLFLGSSTRDDDGSTSSWSSDNDAEFEEPSDQEVDDEAQEDFDEDSISDDASIDEEYARNPEEARMEAHSNLLDSMQSAQRLLLSSARQNPTNRNTLIIAPESNRITGGVPLRRQNAIRVKRREETSPQKSSEEVAKAYHEEFQDAISKIKASSHFPGKSPIFSSGSLSSGKKSPPLLRRWGTLRHSSRKSSLDSHMDRFLSQRRAGKLWPEPSSPGYEQLLVAKRPHPHESHHQHQKRHHRLDTSIRFQRSADPNASGATTRVKKLRKRSSSKRKLESDESNMKKRRKTKSCKDQLLQYDVFGDKIDENQLSNDEKYRILSGLDCSFLSSGSSFSLGPLIDCHSKRNTDVLDLNFSHVDNDKKTMHGYFNISNDGSDVNDFHLLSNFISYLCGGIRSQYLLNCTNKVIQSKASLLNDAFMLGLSSSGMKKGKISESIQKSLNVPFYGNIVDFDKCDLRFLDQTKMKSHKSSVSQSFHHSRVRNEQVKLQLLEWLRIRPFSNFGETFFLNYLHFIERRLRDFDRYTRHEQELTLEFTHQFKESIYEVSRGYEFVTDEIPMYRDKFQKAMWDITERFEHEPRCDLPKSFFLLEWESKLCEKLCEHITHEDSCLFNVQLNYALFVIRVDVSKTLDQVFRRFLENVDESHKASLLKRYEKLNKESLPAEAKEAVFVCSVNRKTGRLEMQNTRSYLDYK
ncbi:hypothetical protein CA3LBN_000417 [Candidozyma haemuli]|uniref:Uncharacterized protein n=1 Tax=Candidozyma haemuli TaxID=45357 RepID=A0ABX8I1E1_9ASCO|nr:hypothetical protein CA3LBN_000417 [[Candida] haemuloni]